MAADPSISESTFSEVLRKYTVCFRISVYIRVSERFLKIPNEQTSLLPPRPLKQYTPFYLTIMSDRKVVQHHHRFNLRKS